ncbi:MAG: outer membrane beta-barrel protein [Pseudobdellovibrio sp.]
MKKLITVSLIVFAISPFAKAQESPAGLFVEPAITYETGDTSSSYGSLRSDSSGSIRGYGIGARLGFHINESFFIALDGRYSQPDFSDVDLHYDAKSVSTNWGPVVGIQMPAFGLRLWGALVMNGEINPESNRNLDLKYQNGTGYRVGAGFRIAAISINLEYQDAKYDKVTLEQIGPFVSGANFSNVDLTNKAWITSLSFPLQF